MPLGEEGLEMITPHNYWSPARFSVFSSPDNALPPSSFHRDKSILLGSGIKILLASKHTLHTHLTFSFYSFALFFSGQ